MAHPTKQLQDKFCKWCKKPFSRRRFGDRLEDASRFKARKFCSKPCANSRQDPKDRTTYHLRARKHLKANCEICGSTENLEAHHKDKNIKNNTPENLKTLCRHCHMKLHWKERSRNPRTARKGSKHLATA